MSHEVYYQFPQSEEQARRAGARGGKTTARHRRERLQAAPAPVPQAAAAVAEPFQLQTTAAAIALLDAQYPWLREPRGVSRTVRRARRAE